MIDLSKISFTETSGFIPGSRRITGQLHWSRHYEVSDEALKANRSKVEKSVHSQLRALCFNETYGDLLPHIYRLEAHALKYADMVRLPEIQAESQKLRALLNGEQAENKGVLETKEERYWIAAIETIEPLPFDMRVAIIQNLVAKVCPPPNSMRDAVLKLMVE